MPGRIRTLLVAALLAALCACAGPRPGARGALPVLPGADVVAVEPGATRVPAADGPRILCVTAHPDDEIAFAGVLYKATSLLGGVADVCVLTDGQGGFKYATLAEPVYGLELTDEAVGRRYLPAIRREELRRGCSYLGVRAIVHLDQKDHRYTQDVDEVLGPDAHVWDVPRVQRALAALLDGGHYDVVLVLTPTPETHAHHKAASILAARAVAALPVERRPALLCVESRKEGTEAPPAFVELPGWPATRVRTDVAPFVFDRRQPLGFHGRLDYRIIANWAIAEHKSQGTMQLLMNATDQELYHLMAASPPGSAARMRTLFERLAAPQYPSKEYGPSAGTNAVSP